MKRTLSSSQTFFIKFIVPALWLPLFGLIMLGGLFRGAPVTWPLLLVFAVGAVSMYWYCMRLKKVSIDDTYLYVSNYFNEIPIPLSNIADVTENVWVNIHPVTIHLNFSSEFGDQIVFMPKTRVFGFMSSHPVVAELRQAAMESAYGQKMLR